MFASLPWTSSGAATPFTFRIRSSVRCRRRLGEYPASAGWTLNVHLAGLNVPAKGAIQS